MRPGTHYDGLANMRQAQRTGLRFFFLALAFTALSLSSGMPAHAQQSDATLVQSTLKALNDLPTVKGEERAKGYKTLFDAYVQMSKPPMEVGESFNLKTIHPKMKDWAAVSGWAESNSKMADAIIACKAARFTKIGLPYGRDGLDPKYVKAGVIADVGLNGSLRDNEFPYMHAVDVIAAFATAESYRLLEVNQSQRALDLYVAFTFVSRVFADREFLAEKMHFVDLTSNVLENMRDMFYTYQDRITQQQYSDIAQKELPFLRPDRSRLFMPEADRIVSEALIREVFNEKGDAADAEKFALTFAEVQSKNAPMTRFGAAKRWRYIAGIHSSLEDSLTRLKLIYDDWWRRWRIDQYDEVLLAVPTQFTRTNPIRYAAVIYSLQNLSDVFAVRNTLVAEVNGTAVAAGLCAYKKQYSAYPNDKEKVYGQFLRRTSDSDPYDKQLLPFKYRLLSSKQTVDGEYQRATLEAGEAMLYSLGQDHDDDRGAEVRLDGSQGDLLIWPPVKAVARQQGLIE